jgi:MFS family permease
MAHRRSALWRHGDYLRLWGAQGISAFGSQITLVALPLVAILTLEASTFEVAVLTGLELAPFVLLGIPAGVWVDRLRRRPILVATDVGRGVSLVSIPVAYALDALTLPQLYAVAVVNGVLTVFFTLAYQAYLPVLVERRDLVDANARFEATETLARLGGPGAGGVLVQLVTAPVAVLVDAVSFFLSGGLIASIRREEPAVRDDGTRERRSFRAELRDGGRLALRNSYMRSILATTALLNVGFGMVWAVLLVFAVRELDISPAVVGLVLSAGEIGGLVGALATTRLLRMLGAGPLIVLSAGLFPAGLLVLGLAPGGAAAPFLMAGWALESLGGVVYNATTVSLRQAYVPLELQARVVGFNRSLVWGATPVGALLGGAVASVAGLRVAIVAGAFVALAALVPALTSPLRTLRELPEPAPSA